MFSCSVKELKAVDDCVSWQFEENNEGELIGVIYIAVSKWNSDTFDTVCSTALQIKETIIEGSQDVGSDTSSAASSEDCSGC